MDAADRTATAASTPLLLGLGYTIGEMEAFLTLTDWALVVCFLVGPIGAGIWAGIAADAWAEMRAMRRPPATPLPPMPPSAV